jgi:hypothetical protein
VDYSVLLMSADAAVRICTETIDFCTEAIRNLQLWRYFCTVLRSHRAGAVGDPQCRDLIDHHWLSLIGLDGFVAVTADPDTGAVDRDEACCCLCAATKFRSHGAAWLS